MRLPILPFLNSSSRRMVVLVACLLMGSVLPAQKYTFEITSSPDSAKVSLNGEALGKTPYKAAIDWSQVPGGGFEFVLSKPSYEDQKFVVAEKPKFKENYKTVKLEKIRPHFDLDSSSVLVNFDKLMTEFPLGKIIGHNKTFYGGDITWEAYSRVGVQQFAAKADDILGSAGFRTPLIRSNELFSDQNRKPEAPRFLIGGKVTDIWVGLGPSTLIGIMAKNWCTIEWKVFDKALNKVVLTDVSRGEFEGKYTSVSELNTMMDLFQDALENFLLDGKLYEVVKNAGASAPFGNANAGTDAPNMRLSLVSIPQFGSSSEMIQFASHACVTVQTPGLLASGVMISESGLMVTVADIAATGSLATVVLSNGTELETKLLVKDEESNLALFQVLGSKFKALPLGKGLTAGLGEEVVTIGTPLKVELGQSVTKGILSGKRQQGNLTLLQTDLTLSPGNGGGPIINREGRVIGIINSRIEGFGFAVPIETVLKRLGLEAGE